MLGIVSNRSERSNKLNLNNLNPGMNFLGKKMKRNRIIISLLVLILSLCISACLNQQASAQKIPIKGSATLFFHGGGSSYHAEEHMVKAAENAGVTDSVIRTEVADNDRLH
ncbi:hypothetical protein LABF186_15140 [Lactobacillus amylovorus subsp. animalium]|uniref:Alpha/beta hydrolase n=1 Tax=Lactobacillus amylovorus subsp. animalium TaxID=3378536 RepID=A0ABD0C546_LACAM|nr:hypothetical protein LABF186_15140 [Lactobacillus amylovorus]GMM16373.1 hypothetical protein LABF125_15070 [Lactobacillus amylovorus]